jgi:hypothetical protein
MRSKFLGWFLLMVGSLIFFWPKLEKKPKLDTTQDSFFWGYDPDLLRCFLAVLYILLGVVLLNWHKLMGQVFSNMITFFIVGIVICVFLFFLQCKSLVRAEQKNIDYEKDAAVIQNVSYTALALLCLLLGWLLYQYIFP